MKLEVDQSLPIAARADEIVSLLRSHQTVIVAGATGSGKSTQLPKLALVADLASGGIIGMTQPRRIAARSIAARLAEELGSPVGDVVGYQMRFASRVSDKTLVKVMTDGTLLAELTADRSLKKYGVIIIDEAHERSLNIDFLLGYLHRLRARRPELKIVITSATIDTERIAAHFEHAPVVVVEGRTYPVEIRYRPVADGDRASDPRSLAEGIGLAVDELTRVDPRGDILVFLSGEREIHDVALRLRRRGVPDDQILPLYSRLPRARQERIFKAGGARRIVLATNIAETSLTIPGVRFVIDSGLARISRYSHRSKIQRLQVEAISQASANQRAGRCGRTSAGVCVRLYAEEDFATRPEFTEPEVLRSDLAGVVLQMKSLRLGDPTRFPFVDPPPDALLRDGYRTLVELGALEDDALTATGHEMARLPADVRVARMLIEADRLGCIDPVVTLAAMLSIQDPRDRPLDRAQAADEAQARFTHPGSDLLTVLKLWRAYEEQRRQGTRRELMKWCARHFLNPARMREWGELRRQFARLRGARGEPLDWENKGEHQRLHRALLPALIMNVGRRDEGYRYRGPRGAGYDLFPGSVLSKKPPNWIYCALILATARVYGRLAAPIDPAWIEAASPHLIGYHYGEPYWSRKQGRVMAQRHASLFDLPLPRPKRVGYAGVDRKTARQVFLREALVEGRLRTAGSFLRRNRQQLRRVDQLQAKLRTTALMVGDDALVDFFDRRVPEQIVAAPAFERWRRTAEKRDSESLVYPLDELLARDVEFADERYPDSIPMAGMNIAVDYRYDRTQDDDGATLRVPLSALASLSAESLEWLIPGWRGEKIEALIRALPKAVRRRLMPAAGTATRVADELDPSGDFFHRVGAALSAEADEGVTGAMLREVELAPHLRFTVAAIDEQGQVVDQDRDLNALRDRLGVPADQPFVAAGDAGLDRDGLTRWRVGSVADPVALPNGQQAWPALVDQQRAVGLRWFVDRDQARRWHRDGVVRLLLLQVKAKTRDVRRSPPVSMQTQLYYAPVGDREALLSDLLEAAGGRMVDDDLPLDEAQFAALVARARTEFLAVVNEYAALLDEIMARHHALGSALDETGARYPEAVGDQREQLAWLVYPGFLRAVPMPTLREYPRYLDAALKRVEQRRLDPNRDASRQRQIEPFWNRLRQTWPEHGERPELEAFHWLLEEWRVSLFAQSLGTRVPVSRRRVADAWQTLAEQLPV